MARRPGRRDSFGRMKCCGGVGNSAECAASVGRTRETSGSSVHPDAYYPEFPTAPPGSSAIAWWNCVTLSP